MAGFKINRGDYPCRCGTEFHCIRHNNPSFRQIERYALEDQIARASSVWETLGSGSRPIVDYHQGQVEQPLRQFETGATRSNDGSLPDYEGFLSPTVLAAYGRYMHKHRTQADGTIRDSDNWQKGIPLASYMKSMFRHFLDVWLWHRGHEGDESHSIEEALCALMFNVMGYLHEHLKTKVNP